MKAVCCKCGSSLKYPVTIGNKVYGTSCASKFLGINDIPTNFSGDYDLYKSEKEISDQKQVEEFNTKKEFTSKNWSMLQKMSKALSKARSNDWETNFICSVSDQMFGGTVNFTGTQKFETMEDAEKGWGDHRGSFPYIDRIFPISDKQLSIIDRIINK
jgi:hypothetical protein